MLLMMRNVEARARVARTGGSGCSELITRLPIGVLRAPAHWGHWGGLDRIMILNIFRLINYITKAKQLFLRCKWLQQLWLCFSYCRKKE